MKIRPNIGVYKVTTLEINVASPWTMRYHNLRPYGEQYLSIFDNVKNNIDSFSNRDLYIYYLSREI